MDDMKSSGRDLEELINPTHNRLVSLLNMVVVFVAFVFLYICSRLTHDTFDKRRRFENDYLRKMRRNRPRRVSPCN